jgi:hypothetical protein
VGQRRRDSANAGTLQQDIAHRTLHTLLYGYATDAGACQYSCVWS